MKKDIQKFLDKTAIYVGKVIYNFKLKKKIEILERKKNLKTNIDHIANEIWISRIKKEFKTPKIISEEIKNIEKINNKWTGFIIDPIDGTKSLIENFNGYVTQVAYVKNSKIRNSVIYNPETNELYSGDKKYFKTNTLNNIVDNYPLPNKIISKLIKELKIPNYIELGGIGYKMCKILDGSSDLFVKLNMLKIWDVAPAMYIIEKNGGYVRDKYFKKISLGKTNVDGLIVTMSRKNYKLIKKIYPKGMIF